MPTKRKINETVPAVLEDLSINEEVKDEAFNTSTKTQLEQPAPKTPRKREDPIARAERLLEEARAKAKEEAAKQLANAEANLDLGEKSLVKALKIHAERRDRVIMLKQRLGEDFELPTSAVELLFGLTQEQLMDALHEAEESAHRDIQSLASDDDAVEEQ